MQSEEPGNSELFDAMAAIQGRVFVPASLPQPVAIEVYWYLAAARPACRRPSNEATEIRDLKHLCKRQFGVVGALPGGEANHRAEGRNETRRWFGTTRTGALAAARQGC